MRIALLAAMIVTPALAQQPKPEDLAVEYCSSKADDARRAAILKQAKGWSTDRRVGAIKKGAKFTERADLLAQLVLELEVFERAWELLAERLDAAPEVEQQAAAELVGAARGVAFRDVAQLWRRGPATFADALGKALAQRPEYLAIAIPVFAGELDRRPGAAAELLGPALGVEPDKAAEEWGRLAPLWKAQAEGGGSLPGGGWLEKGKKGGKVYPRGRNTWLGPEAQLELTQMTADWALVDHELAARIYSDRPGWSIGYGAIGAAGGGGLWDVVERGGRWISSTASGEELSMAIAPGWHEIRWRLLVTNKATKTRKFVLLVDRETLVKDAACNGAELRFSIRAGEGALVVADVAIAKPR